jgi:hypothetical protein
MGGVPATMIGTVGGNELTIADRIAISVDMLVKRHEDWFPRFMSAA